MCAGCVISGSDLSSGKKYSGTEGELDVKGLYINTSPRYKKPTPLQQPYLNKLVGPLFPTSEATDIFLNK